MRQPYCHGAHSPYGGGHHAEHVAAAKKAWETRRMRYGGPTRSDAEWFRALFPDATNIHTHPSHKGIVMFRQKGKWYELPEKEYRNLAHEGRAAQHERDRAIKRAEKQARQERAANERAAIIEVREELRRAVAEKKMEVQMSEMLHREAIAPYKRLVARLRRVGVRPTKDKRRVGRFTDRGEFDYLPSGIMRLKGGYSIDDAVEQWEEDIAASTATSDEDYHNRAPSDFFDYMSRMQLMEQQWERKRDKNREELRALERQLVAIPTKTQLRQAVR